MKTVVINNINNFCTSLSSATSPLLAATSAISIAPLVLTTTFPVSKIQRFDNVPKVSDVPHQPNKTFPSRESRKKKIAKFSFQKDWFAEHPWIHYHETCHSAFCHVCIWAYHQNCISDTYIEQRWISEGHTNWKDAACEGRGFKGHELL